MLNHTFGGRNIGEVLAMPVSEATAFFDAGDAKLPAAHKILDLVADASTLTGQHLTEYLGV
ncbi:MAG: daunorubicin resistance protein DrrC [Aeromicrobium sp.]|nr:daunorubicin resistance protein DrrC [Aeromicrobium sp.]